MCNTKMAEKKRKFCEADTPSPPSPSPSPSSPSPSSSSKLQLQFHPSTPKISRSTPKFPRRMDTDICYRCRQQGHWSLNCPLNTSIANHDSQYPQIWCRCGHGFCVVKTVININNKNLGKKYYACPIKRGKKCREIGFIKWCDAVEDSDFQPPEYKFPECECGGGVCRRVKGTESKYYFTCPVKEGHGSCGYLVWEDELLNNKSIVPIQPSSQRTHVFLEGYQNDETNLDLGLGGDLLVEHSKRMRMMDKSENLSSVDVSELPESEDASLNETPSKCVGFPEFEVAEYLQDLEFANSLSWETFEEEPFLLSHPSTPSRIPCGHSVSQSHTVAGGVAVADSSFGPCTMGWLGRLIYFQPTQSLKFPQPQPFSCCIFPSVNSIDVPKQASIRDGPFECNQLSISSLSQHNTQLSAGCQTEVSKDVVSSNKSPGSERKPMSKAQRHRQVVLLAQQQLLTDLVTLNIHEHESMREAARDTFDLLRELGVNYEKFSKHVSAFIDLASSMAEMDKTMENSLTVEECNKHFEEEKVRLARIKGDYLNTEALLEASSQRRHSLIEEVSHLEAMLHEKRSQLKSLDSETSKIETQLGDLKRSMMEAEATLKDTAEEAGVVRQLNEERQAKEIAAKRALEMAKLELENV